MESQQFRFAPSISSVVPVNQDVPEGPLSADEVHLIHRWWQAANYLTVGQIYLRENALLREPLRPEHIKPRLLGHWGTSPGLSFIYAHLNHLIKQHDADVIYLAGPGHGGPAIVANVYLEGTYSEVYPEVSRDEPGLTRLFRQFSTPGGIPSHVSVPTPGSIHEGGELGYVLTHAFGAAFDNPDLIVAAVIGDGEAETGPLAGSWRGINFLNPIRDGAVLPILHLNGYKIGGPTLMARDDDVDVIAFLEGNGYEPHLLAGDDPFVMHQSFAFTLEACYKQIRTIQREARTGGFTGRSRWPVIVLRSPKGWTGPKELDGKPVEGTFRAHQVPIPNVRDTPEHLALLETWLRSYEPDKLFDDHGTLIPELAALAPTGDRRMGSNPHANGGKIMAPLNIPPFRQYAIDVPKPASEAHESTRQLGLMLRDIYRQNEDAANFRLFCPDETASNRLDNVFEVESRCFVGKMSTLDESLSADGRVMEVLSEHNCEGWLEGYLLTGRHGLFATYESFAMVAASMIVQFSKWLKGAADLPWRAPVASLNILLTSTCWRNDHNGFSHQGPGLIDVVLTKGQSARIYFPPDANCLLSVADHCFRSRDHVNLIVIDKQPQLQWLDMDAAIDHCKRGAGIWRWASTDDGRDPDIVLACSGDIPTLETVAAADWLRKNVADLKIRVVNVVDLMCLFTTEAHPNGVSEAQFVEWFTDNRPVVFAFHGYQRLIHEVVHGRSRADRFHVRGFNEQGTTTTPFDMVVLNGMSRFDLCMEAIKRSGLDEERKTDLTGRLQSLLADATAYSREHMEDMPSIRDWIWS